MLCALEMTFHMRHGSIMRFILRGRRSILRGRRNHHAPTFSVSLVFYVVLKGRFTKVSSYEVLKFDYNRVAQRIMDWRIVAKRIEGSRIVKKRTE